MIIHATHHKAGSVLFRKILDSVAQEYGFNKFWFFEEHKEKQEVYKQINTPKTICFDWQSIFNFSMFHGEYKGSHMVRDPREVIISGYFYHLRTDEAWCHEPNPRYNGRSYQEYLLSLSQEEGIFEEMKTVGNYALGNMRKWNYQNPNIIELRYEDVMKDFEAIFERVFRFYGFDKDQVTKCVAMASKHNVKNMSKDDILADSHITNKALVAANWHNTFTNAHIDYFKKQFGGLLIDLKYETNNNW